ncbi:unnamed protein product [Echinostoma caproni]|uniref:CUB domain-containing protein n=1 Tax=Echinostoma caproni TaxID=27848 RepID=A0A183AAU2_9TREM|nr:unnamed protein product [Echinostoma caproni]
MLSILIALNAIVTLSAGAGEENNCGASEIMAAEAEKVFALPQDAKESCEWYIITNDQRTVRVTWPGSASLTPSVDLESGNCITVITLTAQEGTKWCTGSKDLKAESKSVVRIQRKYPADTKDMQKIELNYQLVNDAECTEDIKKPTDTLQSFDIAKSSGAIKAEISCVWELETTAKKNIEISLNVQSPATDAQCVKVSNAASSGNAATKTICGKSEQNTFTGDAGSNVLVAFDGPKSGAENQIQNFKVNYRLLSAGSSMSSTLAIFGYLAVVILMRN